MRRAAIARALGLTDSNLALINDAIRDAERNTSGEIAIAITRESSDYSFRELFVSVLLGGILASGGILQRQFKLPDATILVFEGLVFLAVLFADSWYGRFSIFKER